jgi:DNA polymerase/3'-5' exonuclease PolX
MTYAGLIDKNGKIHKNKNMKEGECRLPFRYKKQLWNECIEGKNGFWCATETNDRKTIKKYGYCKDYNEIPQYPGDNVMDEHVEKYPKALESSDNSDNNKRNSNKKFENKKINSNFNDEMSKDNKVYAGIINKHGKKITKKNFKEGSCSFPFKYYGKLRKECIDSKDGLWCATETDKDLYPTKYGYCTGSKGNIRFGNNTVKLKIKYKKKIKLSKKKSPENGIIQMNKQINKDKIKDYKDLIIEELEIIKKGEVIKKDRWRTIAYNKAIKALKEYNGNITSVDQIRSIKGIGDKIATKIQEILDTGKLEKANKLRKDPKLELIDVFGKIMSVGDVTVLKIINDYNIKSLDELKEKAEELELNDKIKLGLKYYDDLLLKIPRSEMNKHNKYIIDEAKKLLDSYDYRLEMVGSYRRRADKSGDIDIIISENSNNRGVFKKLVDGLIESGYITDVIGYGNKKFNGICKFPGEKIARRIDILYTSPEKYPFAKLYFTGSGPFNQLMRLIVKKKGYKLNEYSLQKLGKDGKSVAPVDHKFNDEQDIFKYLGFEYIEPKNRTEKALEKYS